MRESLAQKAAVVGQQARILVTQPLQQLGRAFDIGEKECDRPGRCFLAKGTDLSRGLHTHLLYSENHLTWKQQMRA